MRTKEKNVIFMMNLKGRKYTGKKTNDSHYMNWNGEKFIRCKKSEIPVAEILFR